MDCSMPGFPGIFLVVFNSPSKAQFAHIATDRDSTSIWPLAS